MTLKLAVGLLWVQAVGLIGLAVTVGVASLTGRPTDRNAGLVEAAGSLAVGVLLGLLGYWLIRGHRAARGPAVFLQLMLLAIGYFMIQAGLVWAGVLAIALGLLVGGLLIAPATRESLGIH